MTEADVGWYLRHRDGIEHGPFRLVDIVAAAKAGNVVSDTCVRHESHTKNQWVFAVRVQPIAQSMTATGTAGSVATAKPSAAPVRDDGNQKPTAARAVSQPPAVVPNRPQPNRPQPNRPQPSQRDTSQQNTSQRNTGESVFAQPATTSPAAAPKEPEASKDREPAGVLSEVASAGAARPNHSDTYPVPRRFLGVIQVLFTDFGFRRFITPWIVKTIWVICLSVAVVTILFMGYLLLVAPASTDVMPKGTAGSWEFQPTEGGGSMFTSRLFLFLTYASFITIGTLTMRMFGELIIVFVRASGEISEVRKLLKQQTPPKS